jgi:hypothetical protein
MSIVVLGLHSDLPETLVRLSPFLCSRCLYRVEGVLGDEPARDLLCRRRGDVVHGNKAQVSKVDVWIQSHSCRWRTLSASLAWSPCMLAFPLDTLQSSCSFSVTTKPIPSNPAALGSKRRKAETCQRIGAASTKLQLSPCVLTTCLTVSLTLRRSLPPCSLCSLSYRHTPMPCAGSHVAC